MLKNISLHFLPVSSFIKRAVITPPKLRYHRKRARLTCLCEVEDHILQDVPWNITMFDSNKLTNKMQQLHKFIT